MGKRRVLTALLLVMATVTAAWADEVISIDINNYGNTAAFAGEAAVPGATAWIAYDGGWGIPAGSPRSGGLAEVGQVKASTYAAQVWLADQGNHGYVTGAGSGLLDDGFAKNGSEDPNLLFVGVDNFAEVAGDIFAYGGVFDIYVYGDSAGSFSLTDANNIVIAGPLAVTGTASGFVEGQNYVVFENVNVANPSSVRLVYTNELNAIQLVKKDAPKAIVRHTMTTDPNDYTINAPDYDVAMDTNARSGENTFYGPDINEDEIFYLDTNESMEYDIVIDSANEGRYDFYVDLTGDASSTNSLEILLDGALRGKAVGTGGSRTPAVALNLFEGTHVIKWRSTTQDNANQGANVDDLVFNYAGPIMFANCAEVKSYGMAPVGDITGDCRVNLQDLAAVAADWALCYDPANCD